MVKYKDSRGGNMNISLLLYVQINLIGMVLLLILLSNQRRKAGFSDIQSLFNAMIYTNILIFAFDIITILMDGIQYHRSSLILFLLLTVFYVLCVIAPYTVLKYCLYSTYENTKTRRIFQNLNYILLSFNLFLISLNVVTPILFYVDEFSIYQRGPYLFIPFFISIISCSLSWILPFIEAMKTKNRSNQRQLLFVSLFGIILLIATFLQLVFNGLPLVWITFAIFILMLYVNVQNRQLMMDVLTGVNNRYAFDAYIEKRMKDQKNGFTLYMIDLDQFKEINDTYGHIEGDYVLQDVANGILKACVNKQVFISRYGGDEFIVVFNETRDSELLYLKTRIHEQISLQQRKQGRGYNVEVSIGYYCSKEFDSKETIIMSADTHMYKRKKNSSNAFESNNNNNVI